jgi:nicotinamidase-related amidase
VLLDHLQCHTLIVTGVAGNICVLFTANDAYMRDFKLLVPSDCIASNTEEENHHALMQMQKVLKADIATSEELIQQGKLSPRSDVAQDPLEGS